MNKILLIIFTILSILFFVIVKILPANYSNVSNLFIGVSATFLSSIIIAITTKIVVEWKIMYLWFKTNISFKRNDPIRLSISYLCKIELDGKYILIKNVKQGAYQPVGGVYQYFKEETKDFFDKIGVIPYNHDSTKELDMRFRLNQRKNLVKFLKWFDKKKDREQDPFREFYEEMVSTKIVSKQKFKYISYNLIKKSVNKGINYSEYFGIDEYLHYDIFDIKFNLIQSNEIKKIINNNSNDQIIVVSYNDIERCVVDVNKEEICNKKILPHSKHLI